MRHRRPGSRLARCRDRRGSLHRVQWSSAVAEAGQECVLLQRRTPAIPAHLAGLPVHAVQADVADLDALLAVGKQYPITGIVHLAVTRPGSDNGTDPVDASARTLAG